MVMTSKERLLSALNMEIPDRCPATVHQWQNYHLKTYMGGITDLEAFREVGLDAAVTIFFPKALIHEGSIRLKTPTWKIEQQERIIRGNKFVDYKVETPKGILTCQKGYNEKTQWVSERLIKNDEDIYLLKNYMPVPTYNKKLVAATYEQLKDDGILRTLISGNQGGCWQDACVLYGIENLIFATFDKPDWVHEFLNILVEHKLKFIEKNMPGLKVDLVETGGGSSSNTVISPKIHKEFCLPYDLRIHDALHSLGHKVVYHTCGGMMKILDLIPQNHCNASETLSPPGVGGDIKECNRKEVKEKLGSRVALIGGLDQINILSSTPEVIRQEVYNLFEVFGKNGGFIMSASDHFFGGVPKENLIAYARAAKECLY